MRLETHLTHKLGWFEHFNDPDTALSYLASLHCTSCVQLYVLFLCFIMNVFVTRRSRSSGIVLPAARCLRPCQHVEASNNLFITPPPGPSRGAAVSVCAARQWRPSRYSLSARCSHLRQQPPTAVLAEDGLGSSPDGPKGRGDFKSPTAERRHV